MRINTLAPLLCLLPLAAVGQDLLTLNVYATNAPANALSVVVASATTYINILLSAEPSDYIWLEPGEAIPDDRKLEADESVPSGDEADPSAVAVTPSIRGAGNRDLGYMYSCPTTCAKSSSSSCKQLGCAYCGTKCRRRRARELLLSNGDASLIESTINLLLRPLCLLRLGCSVKAELFRVTWDNSTAIQTPIG
jgi:hypothetical protein